MLARHPSLFSIRFIGAGRIVIPLLIGFCVLMIMVPVPGYGISGRDIPLLRPTPTFSPPTLIASYSRHSMKRLAIRRDFEHIAGYCDGSARNPSGEWLRSKRSPQIEAYRECLCSASSSDLEEPGECPFHGSRNFGQVVVLFTVGFGLVSLRSVIGPPTSGAGADSGPSRF